MAFRFLLENRAMQVISFINMKGGVGKTTLAVNVAYGLAAIHKKKVLMIDADPQFNATQYLISDTVYLKHVEDTKKGTLHDIFDPNRAGAVNTVKGSSKVAKRPLGLQECIIPIYSPGADRGHLHLIPSTLNLMDIETSKRGTERKLDNFIRQKAGGYDYVLIDCPPTVSIFTQAAILASDKYLVPLKPDPLSVIGLPLLEKWLGEFSEDAGKEVDCVGLVFTMIRGPLPSAMRDVITDLERRRKKEVFTARLSVSQDVAKSVEHHQPVFYYKSGCKTGDQIVKITEEFLKRTS